MVDLEIISRTGWGARDARHRHALTLPTSELWLHHTASTATGAGAVRDIQQDHMDGNGWSDIAYNFLIDPSDLAIYEGRGAWIKGGHTMDRNSISHGIAVLGNFETQAPTVSLLQRIAELVAYGHHQRWWPPKLGGHRDVVATLCPGAGLYAAIRSINEFTAEMLGRDLGMPDRTDEVKRIQTALNTVAVDGPPLVVDGDPGPKTVARAELVAMIAGDIGPPDRDLHTDLGVKIIEALDLMTEISEQPLQHSDIGRDDG